MTYITILQKIGAGQRTKNRLREHGYTFQLLNKVDKSLCMQGNPPAVLVACLCKSHDQWQGWLSEDEITFTLDEKFA